MQGKGDTERVDCAGGAQAGEGDRAQEEQMERKETGCHGLINCLTPEGELGISWALEGGSSCKGPEDSDNGDMKPITTATRVERLLQCPALR